MAQAVTRDLLRSGALRLAIIYFVVATLWIIGSDHVVAMLAQDAEQLRFMQSVKGITFVFVMTLLVGIAAARLSRTEAARQQALLSATTDSVTQLPNARTFYELLGVALSQAGASCAVLLVDFRHFARVNATFGRRAGDQALFNIGRRLRTLADDSGNVARLEEDKFAVLLPDTAAQTAATFATRIVDSFRSELRVAGQSLPLDLNVGYAVAHEDGDQVSGLLDAADLALRAAKEAGHNTVQRFDRELLQTRREHFHLEAELRQALNERRLTLELQPQYELDSGVIDSAEALIRWTHPSRGPISPGIFIPVAERSGLIERVGDYVLNGVCRIMADWRRDGLPAPRVAVNVAGHQLDDERLGFYLVQAAEEWGVPLSALELEITETMAMRNPERAVEVLNHLRGFGVTIALDDFGTGYSSLSYLLQLPIDKLKIDRSFISMLAEDRRQRSFVHTLITLGRDLGMRVVAEGIETEAQRELLRTLGCDLGQGYLLGRPMSVADFGRLLRTGSVRPAPG